MSNKENHKRSSLHEAQKKLGATFDVIDGWEIARSYSDPLIEHEAVRREAGLIDLSYCGALKISGTEAPQFLNGLVTNNARDLMNGKGMRAAFLTGHGKVKGFCRVFKVEQFYLVINDAQTHEAILDYVTPFSYAGDFKVEEVS